MKKNIGKILITALLFSSCKNEDHRTILLNDIKKAGYPKNEVAIDFHIFFDGNNEIGSIAPNADSELKPEVIYEELKKLKSDNRTKEILVRISDIEDGNWPYSDAIYVIGNWSTNELKKKTQKIQPDEIVEGWFYEKPANITYSENTVITLWWD